MIRALIAFVGGAGYEVGCVAWVHHSESGNPWRVALSSLVLGGFEVAGLFESVHDLHIAPFYVAGLAVDSGVGTWAKERLTRGR